MRSIYYLMYKDPSKLNLLRKHSFVDPHHLKEAEEHYAWLKENNQTNAQERLSQEETMDYLTDAIENEDFSSMEEEGSGEGGEEEEGGEDDFFVDAEEGERAGERLLDREEEDDEREEEEREEGRDNSPNKRRREGGENNNTVLHKNKRQKTSSSESESVDVSVDATRVISAHYDSDGECDDFF